MKVYLYVLNTLADWEIGFLTAELSSRRYFKNKSAYVSIVKVGNTRTAITTMGGISILPDISVDEMRLTEQDLLLLPGADTWLDDENRDVLLIAKKRIEDGYPVAAICGATIGLAHVGALDAIGHTSNAKELLGMLCPNYSGAALYQDTPAVTEKNLVTASGLAPLEFSYEVLKLLGVFKETTLDAWYMLYIKKEPGYFFELMASLKD